MGTDNKDRTAPDMEITLRDTNKGFDLAQVSVGVAPCIYIGIGDPEQDEPIFKIDATGPGIDLEMVQSLLSTVAALLESGEVNE